MAGCLAPRPVASATGAQRATAPVQSSAGPATATAPALTKGTAALDRATSPAHADATASAPSNAPGPGGGTQPVTTAAGDGAARANEAAAAPGSDAATPGGEAAAPPTTEAAKPSSRVKYRVETPYKLYERPRPEGRVAAAGHDETLARWNVGGTGDAAFISNKKGYHPGARVRVDTEVLMGNLPQRARGRLSQHGVLALSRKYGYWPFRLCFEEGLRRDQKLEGKTIVRLTMNARGRVTATRLVKTELEDESVAECLRDQVRELEYSPRPGRRVDVRMSISLWPGDAPVPQVDPPDDFDNPGRLDVKGVQRAIERVEPEIVKCYAKGLTDDPELWGRVQLELELDETGDLTRVRETESHFPDRRVVRCMLAAFGRVRFEAPDGGKLRFVYAVRFGEPKAP